MNVNKQAFVALATLCLLMSGWVSRANTPPDLPLDQRRKIALPLWDNISKTSSSLPASKRLEEIMIGDVLMHGAIAPEHLAALKAEAARHPVHQQDGKDSDLAGIAVLQKLTGDEAGSRATQATIDVAYIDSEARKLLDGDRKTILRSILNTRVKVEHDKSLTSDLPAASSKDLEPFISFYHQVLQAPQGNHAATQKVLRRMVKRASTLGADSDAALELIASAQARVGNSAGARDTARRSGDVDQTLVRIARIQIVRGDLVGAKETMEEVDPWLLHGRRITANELALALMRKGDGAAAVRTLDEFVEPAVQFDEKCQCMSDFLIASYAAHALRSLNEHP